MIQRNGYNMLWCKRRKRYIYEHRKVYEEHIGRDLTSKELVHHKNGNKLDNRLENLECMTRSEHVYEHIKEGTWAWGRKGPRPDLRKPLTKCVMCGVMYKSKRIRGAEQKACSFSCSNKLIPRGVAKHG